MRSFGDISEIYVKELRSAVRNNRRVLVLRVFNFRLPENWPPGTEDIKEIILRSDTITYMAEFFTECIAKIKKRLGPSKNRTGDL